ncbi:hypothetical protein C1752_05009 [Acaryochloris thomasi RCC1774]|uniref:Uncharacterized protein n=1 Tax=Acaryochloris thomasi RCC1774 TaxID=1764569 RepID=A0A2W1JS76_9CYAN|nr:hypothetical protein [Acaryochloris thomasi]PZD71617.1 hypothetical protein C1752_05009 [Acaryochloris thomasi RCC1774]
MRISVLLLTALSLPLGLSAASAVPQEITGNSSKRQQDPQSSSYQRVIEETAAMVSNSQAQSLARQQGLEILSLTWEDTGRYKNSAVGPNISDMTIQVQHRAENAEDYQVHLMPVIRYPNFSDQSADVRLDNFAVKVGNQKGESLQRVPLRKVLQNLRQYLSKPGSWKGSQKSLLAERDSHVLVSAQASFLPIPKAGKAEFNPVLFNYQSYEGDPAVLTILATREGTSVTVIDNKRDAFEAGQNWGQRLFFNQNGERASLTGERASDFQPNTGRSSASASEAAEEKGLNLVMLIQVPLKQKQPLTFGDQELLPLAVGAPEEDAAFEKRSDVEAAVIGHGEVEGPFTEIDALEIERDPKLPIRVTVQFYKATSNGAVSETDMKAIHQQIARVYEDADYVGSLVVEGETGRPTEYEGPKQQPEDWWNKFWQRHQDNTGQSRAEAMVMLQELLGSWLP